MARPDIRKHIQSTATELQSIMQDNLKKIAASMIDQVIINLRKLPNSQRYDATKNIPQPGTRQYASELMDALAASSFEALKQVRSEVPKARNVKLKEWNEDALMLGDWSKLPPSIRNKLNRQVGLIIDTQTSDLEKALYFQFGHSVDSTESPDLVSKDMQNAGDDYIEGNAIESGATTIAAQVVNESRNAFLLDDSVSEELDALEFVNGDPVSEICQDLAGSVFLADDPEAQRYMPPLHWRCKSYILPILKGDLGDTEVTGLRPSTKEIEDTIQFSEMSAQKCSCGSHFGL